MGIHNIFQETACLTVFGSVIGHHVDVVDDDDDDDDVDEYWRGQLLAFGSTNFFKFFSLLQTPSMTVLVWMNDDPRISWPIIPTYVQLNVVFKVTTGGIVGATRLWELKTL